jgi:hypothetical protein
MRPPLASWIKLPLPTPSRHNISPSSPFSRRTHPPCLLLPGRSTPPPHFLNLQQQGPPWSWPTPLGRPLLPHGSSPRHSFSSSARRQGGSSVSSHHGARRPCSRAPFFPSDASAPAGLLCPAPFLPSAPAMARTSLVRARAGGPPSPMANLATPPQLRWLVLVELFQGVALPAPWLKPELTPWARPFSTAFCSRELFSPAHRSFSMGMPSLLASKPQQQRSRPPAVPCALLFPWKSAGAMSPSSRLLLLLSSPQNSNRNELAVNLA